ncbi:hypothetical protein Anapl_09895 [Anas platyrhynchos]|uniref:Uncharacterized protein n=1 Tax=Anas platyrhynchos TaxID=8839 RepID=R0K6K5_ANAPL|nr:hypothetical protein Anapl_09895 [Anas platyrhynchos]
MKSNEIKPLGRAEHPIPLLRFPQTSRELQAVKNPAGKIASRLAGRGWKEVGGLKKQPGGFAKCSRPTPRSIEQGAGARLEPGTETLAEKQDAKCPRRRRPRAGFGVVMEKMHRVAGLRRRSWLLRALLERKEKFLHPELYGTAGTVQPNPTVSWCRARGTPVQPKGVRKTLLTLPGTRDVLKSGGFGKVGCSEWPGLLLTG